jgi:hypothetical protein
MKQLFFIGAIVALASCGGTEDECCDTHTTTECDTTFLPDSVALHNYIMADSISAKMTH